MTKNNFLPWVGANYTKGINGKRVMVLGESHYCANLEDATPSITIDIIKDLFDSNSEHEEYKNTYTKFIRALVGSDISSSEDKKKAWDSVLFYNYVQTPISGARVRPTSSEFRESEEALFEILEQYRPDVVIVWGYDLYNNLPRQGVQGEDAILSSGKSTETWIYEISASHKVHFMRMLHPSAGYTPSEWHGGIMEIINNY